MATGDVISLQDAKDQLNKTNTTDDTEIQLYVSAVSQFIEGRCGLCSQRAVTETVAGDACVLLVTSLPLVSVTSIVGSLPESTPLGSSVLAALVTDADAGTITNTSPFYGRQIVTYVAGRTVAPAALQLAARIMVQHIWTTQRAVSGSRPTTSDDETVIPGLGYAVPNRALEMMEPFVSVLGFA